MRIKNRKLFFAYALPCIENLVKKGKISERQAKSMISEFSKKGRLPKDKEEIFEVALFYLKKIAEKMGKKFIDEKVIRKYFQEHHNEIVEKSKSLEKCKVKFGKIVKIQKNFILVESEGKIEKYKTFVKNLREGDEVALHWDYVVDRIKKIKILVFGNPLVKKDYLALKIADKLKKEFPRIEFKEFDTAENLEREGKDIMILDTVEGLKKVEIIEDFKKIKKSNIFSLHDFDLSYELEILKRLKLIENFKIIGIPPNLKTKETLRQVKEILSNPSYF